MTTSSAPGITVAIPTYRRNQVLVDTIEHLLDLSPAPQELLVLDQSEEHEPEVSRRLEQLHLSNAIRWVRLGEPSITKAMNTGLLMAGREIVLFLDDDIEPGPDLLAAHAKAHAQYQGVLVAGRVIQPWQEGKDYSTDDAFHFAVPRSAWIDEFMGGNFSLRRDMALAIGGFDENFVRVAYRFEAEFAHRFRATGGRIFFEPTACIHHLKAVSGGTRIFGEHLTTSRPDHSVGAYYYYLRTGAVSEFIGRPMRAVATRFHFRRPWRVPGTLLGEVRGMWWAWRLHRAGPRYVEGFGEGTGDA